MKQNPPSFFWVWSRFPCPLFATAYPYTQRLLDFFVSLLGLLLLGVIIPLLWFANQLFAPGPLIYRQTRVGRRGRLFTLLKLRSMIVAAQQMSTELDPMCW